MREGVIRKREFRLTLADPTSAPQLKTNASRSTTHDIPYKLESEMTNIRLSRGLCHAVGSALVGSHPTLDALFRSSGAPGDPPDLAHHSKWKEWLFRAGQDPDVDSLSVLGNVLEELMDAPPIDEDAFADWNARRERIVTALEADGLRYYQGGRVLPNGMPLAVSPAFEISAKAAPTLPTNVHDILTRLVRGLPRAIYPLSNRRKGATALEFRVEYDVQDLLHAMLRPWVADIRPEEYTPSYAGSSARMDFFLPAHSLVIEVKIVRDSAHARQIGKELTIDIAHYRAHPGCNFLWCVIYDPDKLISNVAGFVDDLSGVVQSPQGSVTVVVEVVS